MAEARPRNLEISEAESTKFFLEELAYSRVLIESTGKSTKSMLVPAMPPASVAAKNVLN